MLSFKGRHFPRDLVLMAVRWKLAYSLSYRNIEELLEERGADVDHSTVQKWVVHYAPQLELAFRKRKRPVGRSWKMDETYIKVRGKGSVALRRGRVIYCFFVILPVLVAT
ncbi:IS66 family transposase [Enterobacter asburiae]